MSLLEDIFLEDEAGEAQELERIIEGDEYDERPRSPQNSDDNSEKEDEAEEDKRRVDPATTKTKREIKNPRFVLNPARLTGPRGIQVIPEHFKDFKFKGKGHEKEDLDLVLKKLEHWAYRLYPKFQFEDCLKKIETLGKKRPVMVHLHKIRSDQLVSEDTVVQQDSSDEDTPAAPQPPEEDEFDKLLQQQIELARATPTAVKPGVQTPGGGLRPTLPSVPKATSSPSISDEQRERILLNRRLAEERRLAKLRALHDNEKTSMNNENNKDMLSKTADSINGNAFEIIKTGNVERNDQTNEESGDATALTTNREMNSDERKNEKKTDDKLNSNNDTEAYDRLKQDKPRKNKSYVIDSSDSSDNECNGATINGMITADVHKGASQVDSAKSCISDHEIPIIDLVGAVTMGKRQVKDVEATAGGETITIDLVGADTNDNRQVKEMDAEIIVVEDHTHRANQKTNTEVDIMIDLVDEIRKPDQIINMVEDCDNVSKEFDVHCDVDQNESCTINVESSLNDKSDDIKAIGNKGERHEAEVGTKSDAHWDTKEVSKENVELEDLDSQNLTSNNTSESNKHGLINETKDKDNIDVGTDFENIDDLMDVDFSEDF